MGNDKKIDKLLNSNYDGIQEYDNDLPRWWLILFYITIGWSAVYVVYYLVLGIGKTQTQILAEEMEAAKQQQASVSSSSAEVGESELLAFTKDASFVQAGKQVFVAKCLACHGPEGQGLVGPNLTDKNWIHGGKITDTKKVIENGVLEKGMLAWKGVLSDNEINQVVAFIYTLRGTAPANPKAPQGDIVE